MPVVRAIASRLGGNAAVDAVDNFAAELVLPRPGPGRGPRIAQFQGRTTLGQWLCPVVANFWRSELRRKRPTLSDLSFSAAPVHQEPTLDSQPCEDLLRPIFVDVCRRLDPEDRLLLQMLILDEVPQKSVAHSLGLHSGTITRRRQHAAETILVSTRRLTAQCSQPAQAEECLGLILGGDDPELRHRLADVLAHGLREPTTS